MLRWITLCGLLIILAGCSGGKQGTDAESPGAPEVGDLRGAPASPVVPAPVSEAGPGGDSAATPPADVPAARIPADAPAASGAERAAPHAAPAQPAHSPAYKRMLELARIEFDRNLTGSARFANSLRGIATELPEVTVTTGDEPLQWTTVELNRTGVQLDAFRFHSPLAEQADMHWIFAVPAELGRWYILPVNGSMAGFTSFQLDWNVELEGASLPPGNTSVFQTLLGGQIQPDQDYIVWYAPPNDQPQEMQVALRLSPVGAHGDNDDLASIATALGTEIRYQTFEASQDGLRSALRTAHSMISRRLYDTVGFRRVLQSVLPVLPEIQATGEAGEVVWNHIVPSESFLFQAVRFKSPLDVPADLQSILVLPDEMLVAGIVPAEGRLPPLVGYQLGVNVEFDGASLPPENLAIIQSYGPGLIEPGREYIYWLSPNQGALPDVDLALHFTPADADDSPSSAGDIARAFRLSLPEPPAAGQVAAAFQRCRRLVDAQQQQSYEFHRLLEFVLPALPELQLSQGALGWNELKLNQQGLAFDAFRVTSPADDWADLALVIAKPDSPKTMWGIAAPAENEILTATRFALEDLPLPDLNLPADNVVIFESFGGSRVMPESESVLYFAPVEAQSMTVQVALRVIADPPQTPPSSAKAVAASIGLALPASQPAPGSRVLSAHTDAVTDVQFTPDGSRVVSCSADGTVRLWNPETGTVVQTLDAGHGALYDLALSGDGTRLAAAAVDTGMIDVWDLETMRPVASLNWNDARPQRVALSTNGEFLAICDTGYQRGQRVRESALAVCQMTADGEARMIPTPGAALTDVEFLPDGNTLVVAGARANPDRSSRRRILGILQLIDCSTLSITQELTDDNGAYYALAVSHDGRRLIAATSGGLLQTWDAIARTPLVAAATGGEYPCLAVAAEGGWVANSGPDGVVRLSTADTLRTRRVWLQPPETVRAVAVSPDGRWVATAGMDAEIHLWDADYVDHAAIAGDLREPLTDSLGMILMPVPPGEFDMGTPDSFQLVRGYQRDISDERPQHHVQISQGFYLSAHEVTVAQFRQFVESTGYRTSAESPGKGGSHLFKTSRRGFETRAELNWKNPGFSQSDDHPVVQVSWDDAMAFCKWLGEKETAIYRLPTEAEWEYACRAGSPMPWSFGVSGFAYTVNSADAELRSEYGRYDVAGDWDDGYVYTAPVGTYLPNGFGLYDMHGNVYEWCADWYSPVYYATSPGIDPVGPATGKGHVQRSSSFLNHVQDTRSADRDWGPPDQAQSHLGFRVEREFPE